MNYPSDTAACPDRGLFAALQILLLWLPLPLGSNSVWAVALLETVVFGLGAWWLLLYLRGRAALSAAFHKAWPALLLWTLWTLYIVLQATPLPAAWIAWLSPAAYDIHRAAEPLTGTRDRLPLSLDTDATWRHALETLAYGVLFGLTLLTANCRRRLRLLALTLVATAFGQALYSSLALLMGYLPGPPEGTFFNRNHLAGYLELGLAAGIGLLLGELALWESRPWRIWLRRTIELLFSPKLILRVVLAVMVVALVLTRSRMGNTAFFASLTVAGLTYVLVKRQRLGRAALVVLVSLLFIDLWIVGSWFGLDKVVERLEQTNLETEARVLIAQDVTTHYTDYWLTGVGLGAFYTVYPHYRSQEARVFQEHAESDYVELFVEGGLLGMALLGSLAVLSAGTAFRAMARRHDRLLAGMGFAALMAMTSLAIHASTDFNLQTPATAASLVVLMAMGWVAAYLPSRGRPGNVGESAAAEPRPLT